MRTVYAIKNCAGETIAEHVRVDLPTGKRMYWQVPGCDPRDGLGGLSVSDLPLYNWHRNAYLQIGQTVVVHEGERAADALWSLGIAALGTVTGASSTPGENALAPLLPFDVVLWPDHDEPGEQHMTRVAATLLRLGGRARRLQWGRKKGDDAADFVARGGDRDTAELLIQAATPWRVETPLERAWRSTGRRPDYEHASEGWRVDQARSHLAEVVEEKLGPPKRRMGRSMFWACPFHAEATPSFKVDTREPFYRCFGCQARGDVFTFLRAMEGVLFKDALSTLAPARELGGIPRFGA
jgi:DNA primase